MIQNSGSQDKVLWSELLPYEFKQRLAECPIVYLPLGLCEPHGQVAAFGLDTIKAEWLCTQAARQAGGIVAPSLGYHIQEAGYHARWLEDHVGEHNPHMTAMPPAILLHFFLYQLRAFANAGFAGIIVISGHSGGNQIDLRRVAKRFQEKTAVQVWAVSDPELVQGQFSGDHAGKYEISQLQSIRPDLVDLSKAPLAERAGAGGSLAIGEDAAEASAAHGEAIMQACLQSVIHAATAMKKQVIGEQTQQMATLTYAETEIIWNELVAESVSWTTSAPWAGQEPVSPSSQWKPYERPY
jgi:creatinine amidohydrolase